MRGGHDTTTVGYLRNTKFPPPPPTFVQNSEQGPAWAACHAIKNRLEKAQCTFFLFLFFSIFFSFCLIFYYNSNFLLYIFCDPVLERAFVIR